MQRILIIALIALFCFSVSAQTSIEPGGSGTEDDPYRISNLNELYWIAEKPERWVFSYVQTADIDAGQTNSWFNNGDKAKSQGWKPIGNHDFMFTGSYDGLGHKIDNLYINRPGEDNIGLFGYILNPAVVANIALTNADITGGRCVGAVAGRARSVPSISGCHCTGSVKGDRLVGGIVGYATYTHIDRSYNESSVSGIYDTGGLAGEILSSTVSYCYNTGSVTSSESRAGGLTGTADGSTFTYCYNAGKVKSKKDRGGLVGQPYWSDIASSYWDIGITEIETGQGGEGRRTEEMVYPYSKNSYEGWDFEWTWTADIQKKNKGYPFLSLTKEKNIEFRIKDINGSGIPGARISIYDPEKKVKLALDTDEEGAVSAALPDGEFQYSVSCRCYGSITENILSIPEDRIKEHTLTRSEYRVTISIDNIDTYLMEGINLRVLNEKDPDALISDSETDGEGRSIFMLPCGEYRLEVKDSSGCNKEYSDTFSVIGSDVNLSLNLSAVAFDAVFTLSDEYREPVNGAKIIIFKEDLKDIPLHVIYSANGTAGISLPCGSYSYSITHRYYETVNGNITIGEGSGEQAKRKSIINSRKQKKSYSINHTMVIKPSSGRDDSDTGEDWGIPEETRSESRPSPERPRQPDDYQVERYSVDDLRPETGTYTGTR